MLQGMVGKFEVPRVRADYGRFELTVLALLAEILHENPERINIRV